MEERHELAKPGLLCARAHALLPRPRFGHAAARPENGGNG